MIALATKREIAPTGDCDGVVTAVVEQSCEDALARMGKAVRKRFVARQNMMLEIKARGGSRVVSLEVAKAAGQSGNTVYQLFRKWSKAGEDWKVLIDRRHCPDLWEGKNAPLPDVFIVFWKQLCDQNQRKMRPAHRALLDQLRRWRSGSACPIPGYDAPPPNATGSSLPRGWAYENLLRHAPNKTELAAMRGGRFKASMTLPTVRRTRVGSYPMAEVQFDDLWHDFEVIAEGTGQRSARRLLQFGAVDMFTTYLFDPGLKPRLKDDATGKNRILNERDFLFYLLWFLSDVGWHPDGTVLILENGTASVRGDFADRLHLATQGMVTVRTGAMSGRPAIGGGYGERAKGNPRFKALKEGLGGLVHNELASLPGQVGMDRDHMPLENFGRNRRNDELMAIAAAHPELADRLRFGFLTFGEAREAILSAYRRINARTDHGIEGWEAAGLLRQEFCLESGAADWLPLSRLDALAPVKRDLMLEVIKADPACVRTRRLSPTEVFQTTRSNLRRLSPQGLTMLLPDDCFVERKVRNKLFEFEDAELGPDRFRYLARVKDEAGMPALLRDGESFLTAVNPYNTDQMLITDARGVFLGVCDRWKAVMAGDVDAMHRMHGKREALYREAVAELTARSGGASSRQAEHNGRVIKDYLREQDGKAVRGLDAEDLLGDEEPVVYRDSEQVSGLDASDLLEGCDE